jgi:hypothetical protein
VGNGPLQEGAHDLVMILPQVHLRKPCYDFYFL